MSHDHSHRRPHHKHDHNHNHDVDEATRAAADASVSDSDLTPREFSRRRMLKAAGVTGALTAGMSGMLGVTPATVLDQAQHGAAFGLDWMVVTDHGGATHARLVQRGTAGILVPFEVRHQIACCSDH
ncbi:hypothetical protein [Streptomyces sp. NPDC004134]|uniref:hypothetical protein n=1 Tax=Streptomyces sp. NPDC004134 TaxID=3364691 RepID=UPI0036B65B7D